MLTLLMALSSTSVAAPAWYYGKITRVWHSNAEGFILTLSGGVLDDCQHKYVYFVKANLGQDFKNVIYSTALSAFHTGQTVGVVIDKSANVNGNCFGLSMDMTK